MLLFSFGWLLSCTISLAANEQVDALIDEMLVRILGSGALPASIKREKASLKFLILGGVEISILTHEGVLLLSNIGGGYRGHSEIKTCQSAYSIYSWHFKADETIINKGGNSPLFEVLTSKNGPYVDVMGTFVVKAQDWESGLALTNYEILGKSLNLFVPQFPRL